MRSEAVEDYLKTIYQVGSELGRVSTTSLAERLKVAPASVTGMIKKLAGLRLVTYEPYHGVALTSSGEHIALEVIRHHRLAELYLANALGVPWDRVHEEAEKWEHVLSEDIEDRIDVLLGHPTVDPHGAPIPDRTGAFVTQQRVRLSDLDAGHCGVLSEVSDHDPGLLRHAASLGLQPGVRLCVVASAPFDGPLSLRIGDVERILGRTAATHMWVTDIETSAQETT